MTMIFVGCGDKAKDSAQNEVIENGFDFGALQSEAEAKNIDLSRIMLKDSAVDSAQNSSKDSTKNPQDFAPQVAKSLAKFYLLEGNIDSQAIKLYKTHKDYNSKATLYLKISSAPDNAGENQSNAIAFITGKMAHNEYSYTIKGELDLANITQNVAQNVVDSNAVANQANQANVAINQIQQRFA